MARDHQHQTLQQKWKAASLSMNALDNLSLDGANDGLPSSSASNGDRSSYAAPSDGGYSGIGRKLLHCAAGQQRQPPFFGTPRDVSRASRRAIYDPPAATRHKLAAAARSGSSLSLYRVEADENFSPPYMPMNYRPSYPAKAKEAVSSPPSTSATRRFGFGAHAPPGGGRGGVASLLRRQHQHSPQNDSQFAFPSLSTNNFHRMSGSPYRHFPQQPGSFLGRSQSQMVLDGGGSRGHHPAGRPLFNVPQHLQPAHPIFAPRGSMMWAMFRPRGNSASVPDVRGLPLNDYP